MIPLLFFSLLSLAPLSAKEMAPVLKEQDQQDLRLNDQAEKQWEEVKDLADIPILTPGLNDRSKAKIRLKNGLEIILISDPDTQESGGLLTVKMGSWNEPKELPGLAHFLEHMLFLGTKKYPIESDFESFLASNRGQSNAFTYTDNTSYMFSVENSGFIEALDRFSSFFKEPLFNPTGVNREVKAIDQEWKIALQNDDRRSFLVLKQLANPKHPFSQFDIGNQESLKGVSQESLKKWYYTHYSADRMRLIIVSILPLEELKALVNSDFKDIPIRKIEKEQENLLEPLFEEEILGKLIVVEPIQDERALTLMWEVPSEMDSWRDEKPWELICVILGDEGQNSVLAELKKRGFAEGLACGAYELSRSKLLFTVKVDLTEKGLNAREEVIMLIFQALEMIKKKGISKERFDETVLIDKLHYQWPLKKEMFDEVMTYAFDNAYEPLESYPERTRIIHTFAPDKIEKFMSALVPSKAIYMLMAPIKQSKLSYPLQERWSGTKFNVLPLDVSAFEKPELSNEIDLPRSNAFLPSQFQLNKDWRQPPYERVLAPEKVISSDKGVIYYLKENLYGVPKIYAVFEVKTPEVKAGSASSEVMIELYRNILEERLSQIGYEAKIAGLELTLEEADEGFKVILSGYSEKAEKLLGQYLAELSLNDLTEEEFTRALLELQRSYKNLLLESPIKQGMEFFKEVLIDPSAGFKQKIDATRTVTLEKFKKFVGNLFSKNYLQGMILGLKDKSEVENLWKLWQQALKGEPYPVALQKKRDLTFWPESFEPTELSYQVKASGSALILALEDQDFSMKKRGSQQILSDTLEKSYFENLRTIQQTGYLVSYRGEEIKKKLVYVFRIQSSTHTPVELLWRTESFIEQFAQELSENITKEQFEMSKNSYISLLKERPKSEEEMGQLLYKLAFEYKDFDWMEKRIEAFRELDYQEFLEISKEVLSRNNKKRIAILINGQLNGSPTFKYSPQTSPSQLKRVIKSR